MKKIFNMLLILAVMMSILGAFPTYSSDDEQAWRKKMDEELWTSINNFPDESIEILIRFTTPASVALKLMHEGKLPVQSGIAFEDGVSFEEMALARHALISS